jgi:hypothetical protein
MVAMDCGSVSRRMRQKDWIARFGAELGVGPGEADFDQRFISGLVSLLKDRGFSNLGYAIHCAGSDLIEDEGDRTEFDALVDLAIELLVGDEPGAV